MKKYAGLSWILDNDQLKMIREIYLDNPDYLEYLNTLVIEVKNHGCSGVQEKLSDARDSEKFLSTVAELEVGRLLAELGENVTFLKDRAIPGQAPDLLTKNDYDMRKYWEVKRVTELRIAGFIADFLRKVFKEYSWKYRIDSYLSYEISIPEVRRPERKKQEQLAEKDLSRFIDVLKNNIVQSFPCLHKEKHIMFKIYHTSRDHGYPGLVRLCEGRAYEFPEKKWKDKIEYDCTKKARKRDSWQGDHLNVPYTIALVYDGAIIKEDLEDWLYEGGIYSSIPEMRNVTGVLFYKPKTYGRNYFYFPNPHSKNEVKDPLLKHLFR